MPYIECPLDDTPLEIPPLSVGVKTLDIVDVQDDQTADGEPQTVIEFKVNEPSLPENGRKAWDRFNFKYEPARVKFKHLCVAAGLSGNGRGVDGSDLIGKTVRATVAPNKFKDKNTGEMRESTQIKDYVYKS